MVHFTYRPDVDGLRAIAVILVLLFHGGMGFSGGYIGVDVFFVLSGYLITGLILKEQQAGTFSMSRFWLRRIRRIIPAATVVTAASLFAGYFLLMPRDYQDIASSAIAQQLMMANFYFWRTTGYFAGAAEFKPLLHMWSLSVEEHFYLLYPPLLLILAAAGRRRLGLILLVGMLLSLILSIWGTQHYPSTAFYLLPTRAWELLLGGLIWFSPQNAILNRRVAETLSFAGLASIIVSGLLLDGDTRFPGAIALVPCLGTAAVIYANTNVSTKTGRFLALRPVVFVGLISYSLYLWHWPGLAYLHYLTAGNTVLWLRAVVLSFTVVLAIISWKYVETPFRTQRIGARTSHLLLLVISTTLGIIVGSSAILVAKGIPGRMDPQAIAYREVESSRAHIHEVALHDLLDDNIPSFGDATCSIRGMVWGDSHAMALIPGLDQAFKSHGICGLQATHSSTAPILDFVRVARSGLNEAAPQFNQAVFDYMERSNIDFVILKGTWPSYSIIPGFTDQLTATVESLTAAGIHVVLVKDVALQNSHVPIALANAVAWRRNLEHVGISDTAHRERHDYANSVLRSLESPHVTVLDPGDYLIDDAGIWRGELDGVAVYRDQRHLSVEGSQLLVPMFSRFLMNFIHASDLKSDM